MQVDSSGTSKTKSNLYKNIFLLVIEAPGPASSGSKFREANEHVHIGLEIAFFYARRMVNGQNLEIQI